MRKSPLLVHSLSIDYKLYNNLLVMLYGYWTCTLRAHANVPRISVQVLCTRPSSMWTSPDLHHSNPQLWAYSEGVDESQTLGELDHVYPSL